MTQSPDNNPDAALLAAIQEWREVWGDVRSLDDEDPRLDAAAQKAIKLERKIARMPAMSEEGYHAKVEIIRKAEFDDDLLLGIMFLLGRDAERLGVSDGSELAAVGQWDRFVELALPVHPGTCQAVVTSAPR